MNIQENIREDGSNPYRKWFDSLDSQARIRVLRDLRKLELGNTSNVKWLGGGIGELKINWGPGYRIYLAQGGKQRMILFGGGTRSNHQQADIDKARELYQEYKQQKKKTKKSQE